MKPPEWCDLSPQDVHLDGAGLIAEVYADVAAEVAALEWQWPHAPVGWLQDQLNQHRRDVMVPLEREFFFGQDASHEYTVVGRRVSGGTIRFKSTNR